MSETMVKLIVESTEPMELARQFLKGYRTEKGGEGVWWHRGNFLVWAGERWNVLSQREMKRAVMRWMENVWVMRRGAPGVEVRSKIVSGESVVADVVFALEAAREARWGVLPTWTDGGEGKPDPAWCIGFQDVVVSVEGGVVRTVPRDETWLDLGVCPVDWDPDAKCELWEKVTKEWALGDEGWQRLNRMWIGYTLLGRKRQRKWMLKYGVTGAGKGTSDFVQRLLQGKVAFHTVECDTLTGDFGLAGLTYAKTMNVAELSRTTAIGQQKVSRLIRNVVGNDPININQKHLPIETEVQVEAAVQISSNQMVELPDSGKGLSAKMLVLPFQKSWDGGDADPELKEKLRGELRGIARWAVEGARQVAAGEKWPETEAGQEVLLKYRVMNNPVDAFLVSCFEQDSKGFVSGTLVRRLWAEWVGTMAKGMRLEVPANQLLMRIEQENAWGVTRWRKRRATGEQVRGLRGLRVLREVEDDL